MGQVPDPGRRERMITMALGTWLSVSPAVWAHSPSSKLSTLITGSVIAFSSLWAVRTDRARYLTAASALWLYVSTASMEHSAQVATVVNNMFVAVLSLVLSLVPGAGPGARTGLRLQRSRQP